MHTFFHGWRRKTGCVTLVMALALMAGWIRSEHRYDSIGSFISPYYYSISSASGRMRFSWSKQPKPRPTVQFTLDVPLDRIYPSGMTKSDRWMNEPWMGVKPEFKYEWVGFHLSNGKVVKLSTCNCFIPYAPIVVALTLLSAYLLLIPSRKRPPTTSQPHA